MKSAFQILLIFSTVLISISAQNTKMQTGTDNSEIDSNKTENYGPESLPLFKIRSPSFSDENKIPVLSLHANPEFSLFSYDWNNQYLQNYSGAGSLPEYRDFRRSKRDLKKYMSMIPKWEMKNDLGVFGEILGYTNFAAAMTLAIIHLSKYRDIDKDKDER